MDLEYHISVLRDGQSFTLGARRSQKDAAIEALHDWVSRVNDDTAGMNGARLANGSEPTLEPISTEQVDQLLGAFDWGRVGASFSMRSHRHHITFSCREKKPSRASFSFGNSRC